MTADGIGCAELREVAPELALGAVSGDERAQAVAHLTTCPACRQLVNDLTRVADDLLLVAPEVEPPPGFESRVLARLGDEMKPRRRAWRSLAAVAAAAALVVFGGVVGATLVDDGERAQPVRTALAISASGRSTCRVVLTGEDPTSLVVSLDGPPGTSFGYVVEAQPAKGKPVPVGEFRLNDGHGILATTVDLDADDVRSVRVFGMDGELLYEAFPAPVHRS